MPPRKPTAPAAPPPEPTESSPFRLDPYAVGGDDYSPADGPVTRNTQAPMLDASPPHLIHIHPAKWWPANGRIYPRMSSVKFIPGVNGVESRRGGGVNASAARQNIEEAGGRIIDSSVVPARWTRDYGWTSYLYNLKSAGRPDVTLARWIRAYPGSTATDIDFHLLDEWIAELYARRILAPPQPHILRGMLDKKNAEIDAMSDKAQTMPSLRPLVDQLRATAEIIEKAIEEATAGTMRTSIPVGGDDAPMEGM